MQVGGNGVLQQLNKVNVFLSDIHNLFLTHAHTDHVLGAVWVVRLVMQLMWQDKYNGVLHVWGHGKVLGVLRCVHTLPGKTPKRNFFRLKPFINRPSYSLFQKVSPYS